MSRTETLGSSDIEKGKQDFTRLQGSISYFPTQRLAVDIGFGQILGAKELQFQKALIFVRYDF
ncbi:MAG: hypothetical protein ACRERE_13865 [Candidatus Entotheonellia bacterium]